MPKNSLTKEHLNIETSLLKCMRLEHNYWRYINFIDFKRLLPNTALLLKDYEKYFTLYPDDDHIDFNTFYTPFSQDWHKKDLDNNDIDYYKEYVFPAIENYPEEEAEKSLLGLLQAKFEEGVVSAKADPTKLRKLTEQYEEQINRIIKSKDKDVSTIADVDFDVLDKSHGLPWFLPSLQKGILALTQGQFVVVSADYSAGKSAFVISQAVHTFKELSKKGKTAPILYFNSEGTAGDVGARFLSNLYREHVLGGFEEIVDRREEIRQKFVQSYNPSLFKVIQISNAPKFEHIKKKVEEYGPSLVIIDICDKLAPEENPMLLKKLYDDLRVLSGAHCPIIGTSQSGDTSFFDQEKKEVKNRKWLHSSDMYGSITGKGGAADTLIMIGQETNSQLRYVSVNKLKRGEPVRIVCELENKFSYYKELTY